MELRQLSYFVAVADEAHFTRAAARVSVAQPAVSAQIRRLERELGEVLFHRDRRGVRLTAVGEALLPHARAALAAAQRGRDTIASMRGLLRGALRIGVVRPVDRRLAEALGVFHRAHPAIDITLAELHNEPAVEALSNGDLDVAFIGLHGQPLTEPIRARVVAVEPLVLGVHRSHVLAHRATITLDQLRDQPIITLTRGTGLRTVLEDACRDAGFAPRIVAETGELASLVELTTEGLGIAVMPRSAVGDADLAIVQITRPHLQRRTALVWNEATTPAGRAFLAVAARHFPPLPATTGEMRASAADRPNRRGG
jgi:DNA-binding transcriptional LysR family regulator